MFLMTSNTLLSGVHLLAKNSRTCAKAIRFETASGITATACSVRNVSIWGRYSGIYAGGATGDFIDGVVVSEDWPANADYLELTEVMFWNIQRYGLWLAGGEPFHAVCNGCTWFNLERASALGYSHYGTAIRNNAASSSLIVNRPVFSRIEVAIDQQSDNAFTSVRDIDAEYVKKLLISPGGYNGALSTFLFHGGRLDLHASLATPNYLASDRYIIDYTFGGEIEMNLAAFTADGTSSAKIRTGPRCTIKHLGFWPDRDPYERTGGAASGAEGTGGTFAAFKGPLASADAYGYISRPVFRDGCENADPAVVFNDTSVTYPVVF
jgi:hypothetical protein